jgi:ribosome-binding factor A
MGGRGASHRPGQIGETIRSAIASALLRGDVRDPRIGLLTVSNVEVTRDLSHATVYVMPHGTPEEKDAAVEGLQSAAGFLRRLVAKELTMRTVPELHIKLDRGLEHAQQINDLLAGLHRDETPDDEEPGDREPS